MFAAGGAPWQPEQAASSTRPSRPRQRRRTPTLSRLYRATPPIASNGVVTLTGNGTTTASTTTTLSITSPASGSPSFGQAITLSVTVMAASGTPAGSVTLVVDGAQVGDATLNSSGIASFDLASGLTGGSHTLVAIYDGTAAFNGSVSAPLCSLMSRRLRRSRP